MSRGRGRLRAITGHCVDSLSEGWELGASAAGAISGPRELNAACLDWLPTSVPSTAASSLRAAGKWSLDGAARRFDAEDWWYRAHFATDLVEADQQLWLCFDGLATIADVWLNGNLLLSSTGMFSAHECRIDQAIRSENEIVIRFRSLDSMLAARRKRPRWRVPMLEHQQLRWFRTTLLGRTPGWSPPAAPVGPWRGVRLERRSGVMIEDVRLTPHGDGRLDVSCRAASLDGSVLSGVELILERNGEEFCAPLGASGAGDVMSGWLQVPNVERWWPHTHGAAPLYSARLYVRHADGASSADLGAVGFRSLSLVTAGDDFAIQVNGVPVFCRGACWTPLDPVSLAAEPNELKQALAQVVDAGMNMLRVSGPMVYESDAFLDGCDANGILLWQDFMFASMDYPEDDQEFADVVTTEVSQQLARLQGRPSLAVLCGNSEVEQQAAMWGATRDRWQPELFHKGLAALAGAACPNVPYTPSSAHGGAFPHQVNAGTTSYYGVGAYLRPLDDARRAEVRFASECLAFANVPTWRPGAEPSTLRGARLHHPAWKARTPRDMNAGWDFDDVRDHYLATLFQLDPLQLRSTDYERYLSLGRVATGEAMAWVFSDWRRRRSATRGGLVWFLRDLWAGAGWGLLDATGAPKAAWYYVKRAMAPVAMSMSDEGCNGIAIHLVNDSAAPLTGELEVVLSRDGDVRVSRVTQDIVVAAHDAIEVNAAALFEGFYDLSYAYRFAPPSHDLISAIVRDAAGIVRARAFHFVAGLPSQQEADVGLTANVRVRADGGYELTVGTRRFAQSVCVDLDGFVSEDNFFHLAPGAERHLQLQRTAVAAGALTGGRARDALHAPTLGEPRGTLRALNALATVTLASKA
ncbi:MAG: glycoside hydrolase family 2 protein [Gemmatimonadaceae bacterium]